MFDIRMAMPALRLGMPHRRHSHEGGNPAAVSWLQRLDTRLRGYDDVFSQVGHGYCLPSSKINPMPAMLIFSLNGDWGLLLDT